MTTAIGLLFAGSSFSTYNPSISYNWVVQNWVNTQLPSVVPIYSTLAIGGQKTWANLVKLAGCLTSSITTVLLDTANDVTVSDNKDQCALEGFIRQIWHYNPNIRIIGISSPSWNGQDIGNDANTATPTNLTNILAARTIFLYYGISYVEYHQAIIDLVAGGHHLNEYVSGDTVHPSVTGYALMAQLVDNFLPNYAASRPTVLPDRLYLATEDYEYSGIIKNGTGYDIRTGTWVDNGTQVSSSTPGSTITYSGSFRTIGYYCIAGSYPNVQVTVDGGAPINPFTTGWGGYDTGSRSAHTVVIEVLTSCTIDQFWAT